ncbi:hypothetical protein [Sphingobacterium sp. MYb382]|uniref:hypothetical protein n=1 Tax=Sphingobacterium sp. MYb382 TaxID=2745278 RepID=UPI0030B17095
MKKIILPVLIGLSAVTSVFAQQEQSFEQNQEQQKEERKEERKSIFNPKNHRIQSNNGRFYVHWGYNFSWYNKSDIRFRGPGYDFTLHDVKAGDRPSKLSLDYINPAQITIPQFNFHFGYFINDNYSISLGWDHMKYVVETPQSVKFTGYADKTVSDPGVPSGVFGDTKSGDMVYLNPDDFKYEHTDGYNFATVALERYDDIWVAPAGKMYLTMQTGVEAGLIIPRSDVRIFGEGKNHFWNIAGYGGAAKVGAQFHFNKRLYLQGSFKTGWTDMRTIPTTGRKGIDKASQKIWFYENYWVLGFKI